MACSTHGCRGALFQRTDLYLSYGQPTTYINLGEISSPTVLGGAGFQQIAASGYATCSMVWSANVMQPALRQPALHLASIPSYASCPLEDYVCKRRWFFGFYIFREQNLSIYAHRGFCSAVEHEIPSLVLDGYGGPRS